VSQVWRPHLVHDHSPLVEQRIGRALVAILLRCIAGGEKAGFFNRSLEARTVNKNRARLCTLLGGVARDAVYVVVDVDAHRPRGEQHLQLEEINCYGIGVQYPDWGRSRGRPPGRLRRAIVGVFVGNSVGDAVGLGGFV